MIDLHMHVLPGLDDGPKSMDESVEMCAMAAEDGTKTITATPHMLNGVFHVTRDQVLDGVKRLQGALKEEGIRVDVKPGADIHIHADLVRFLKEGSVMTLGDAGRYLLLELPDDILPQGLDHHLFSLQVEGVVPIVTHPERNREIQSAPERLMEIVSSGTLIQITAASLAGESGRGRHKTAYRLMEMGMAHLVASDAHAADRRPPGLSAAFDAVEKVMGRAEAEEVFINRPAKILAGEAMEVPEAREKSRGGLLGRLGIPGF